MKNILRSLAMILIAIASVQTINAASVTGNVSYQGDINRPISNVTVILKNITTNTISTYVTGVNGYYEFNNVPIGNYSLTGTTSRTAKEVTYFDPTLLFLYLNGSGELSPLQKLAADVDNSGDVSWVDYDVIMDNILNGTPFTNGTWKFEYLTFAISTFKEGIPKGIGGTCSGDVGGTFVPTINNTPAVPIAQQGILKVSSGESFATRIITQNELTFNGAGLIINYPTEFLVIESIEFKGADYKYTIDNGQIRLVWGNPNTSPVSFSSNETLITINGKCTPAFENGMTAGFSFGGNTSLISPSNKEITNLKFASPVIKAENPSLKLANFPNPFTTSTKLTIYTPEEGIAAIEIYNASGQLVQNIVAGNIPAGNHEIMLDGSQMTSGYYICKMRIQTSGGELSKTIRILKSK